MYKFVIVQDPQGYYTWQLEGPPSRGHSRVVAVAPQSWAHKEVVLAEVKKMKIHMFTAAIVDNARGK